MLSNFKCLGNSEKIEITRKQYDICVMIQIILQTRVEIRINRVRVARPVASCRA